MPTHVHVSCFNVQVLHYTNNEELTLEPGMLFTIEPILAEGSGDVVTWSDGWTAATKDGGWYARIV